MIPFPISEIVDRYTICWLKSTKAKMDMSNELQLYLKEIDEYDDDLWIYIEKLHVINEKIWNLEALIRQGREKELGLEEVGRRALEIRNLNHTRILVKNEIVDKYGGGFKEKKVDHASD